MRVRPLATAAAALALALGVLAQAPAQAMTDNATFDASDAHPEVVAMVAIEGGWAFMYCSGVLVNATTVLTASHCNAIQDEQWFKERGFSLGVTNAVELHADSDGWFPWTGVERQADVAESHTNSLYKGGYRDDVSAQVIEHALEGVTEGQMPKIPTIGLLDGWQKDGSLKTRTVTVFGYGSQQKTIPANTGPSFPDTNERRYADLPTIALDKQWIHQDQNLRKNAAQAGACYGDSGGPSLVTFEGIVYVIGVTSTGDGPCFATNVASRVDNASAHALIATLGERLLPTP